jgi:hypothetical protein
MKSPTRASALIVSTLLLLACGGDQSTASKSAAAYREAQAKGIPVGGGHDHGGHQTATPASNAAQVDHSAHGTAADPHAGHDMTAAGAGDHAAHGTTPAADHAAMGHGAGAGAATDHRAHGAARAVDHAAMGHGTADHARHQTTSRAGGAHDGHRAAPTPGAHDQHAGMQHGTTTAGADPHAQHRQAAAGAPADHAQHATTGADVRSARLPSTLQSDAFDAPAATSISEAAKAAQDGEHEGHQMRGITPGEDRENPPTPMPATRDRTSASGSTTDHSGHGAATVYTCPMHPEVTSDKPGTCPKCGMTLVKKN